MLQARRLTGKDNENDGLVLPFNPISIYQFFWLIFIHFLIVLVWRIFKRSNHFSFFSFGDHFLYSHNLFSWLGRGQKKTIGKQEKQFEYISIGNQFHHNKIHLFISDHISCCNVTIIHKQKFQFWCTMSAETLTCEQCKYEQNKVIKTCWK